MTPSLYASLEITLIQKQVVFILVTNKLYVCVCVCTHYVYINSFSFLIVYLPEYPSYKYWNKILLL